VDSTNGLVLIGSHIDAADTFSQRARELLRDKRPSSLSRDDGCTQSRRARLKRYPGNYSAAEEMSLVLAQGAPLLLRYHAPYFNGKTWSLGG
jgi:hypothetical protein